MTTLEVTHSREPEEISALVSILRPALQSIVSLPFHRRSRLVKPILSHDLAAIALSFLPAVDEPLLSPPSTEPPVGVQQGLGEDGTNTLSSGARYTYHHLRRDVFDLIQKAGTDVRSRYVVPSAHITLGRFLTQEDHATPEMRERWVHAIDEINTWLETEVWNNVDGVFCGEWLVGQERGLDAHAGALWYGGGRSVLQGEGF
jgi:hypothetical protein